MVSLADSGGPIFTGRKQMQQILVSAALIHYGEVFTIEYFHYSHGEACFPISVHSHSLAAGDLKLPQRLF